MNFLNYILVFFGGALGSVLRFGVTQLTTARWPQHAFPIGTFSVNILGSFLIGLLSIYFVNRWPHLSEVMRIFFMVGILGGFTTFSSFSLETINLFTEGFGLMAVGYILGSVSVGLLATFFGILLGKSLYA